MASNGSLVPSQNICNGSRFSDTTKMDIYWEVNAWKRFCSSTKDDSTPRLPNFFSSSSNPATSSKPWLYLCNIFSLRRKQQVDRGIEVNVSFNVKGTLRQRGCVARA